MNNEEAKFILHAYRPNGADAGDASFHAALEQARLDPAIGKWFAAQQAFDRVMCAKLREVTPPAGLREAILAGGKMSAARSGGWKRWSLPGWIGLAASVAVLFAVGVAVWPRQAQAAPLIDFALNDTLRQAHRGQHGDDAARLQSQLGRADLPLRGGVSLDFEALRQSGCRTISFDERPVLEVCFNRGGKWFHCYVARVADFPATARKLRVTFRDQEGATAAAWADAEHIFIVASKGGREALMPLI